MSYVIVNAAGEHWSNTNGWTDSNNFDTFTPKERETLNLPIGGQWVSTHILDILDAAEDLMSALSLMGIGNLTPNAQEAYRKLNNAFDEYQGHHHDH